MRARRTARARTEKGLGDQPALVDDGWSIRRIAAELGVSYTTVRHWLGKYGLKTMLTASVATVG